MIDPRNDDFDVAFDLNTAPQRDRKRRGLSMSRPMMASFALRYDVLGPGSDTSETRPPCQGGLCIVQSMGKVRDDAHRTKHLTVSGAPPQRLDDEVAERRRCRMLDRMRKWTARV